MERATIFFDIDGTLLDEEKRLPQSTKQAIAALKEKGHEVAIATGRAPYFFKELREELEIDSYICFNGQYVVFKGELIYENTLDMDAFTEMERYASSQEHPLVFMGSKTFTSNREDHPYVIKSIKTLKIDLPQYNPDLYNEQPLHQALLFCEEGEEKDYETRFPALRFVRWHPLSVDVLPREGSKANGIAKFVQRANIDLANVYAFGDQLNDLEMLSFVEHGVAMGNAPEKVKAQARYVTKPVHENGIDHGLKMVGLL